MKFWIENSVIKCNLYFLLVVLLFTLYTSFFNCIYMHSAVEYYSRGILLLFVCLFLGLGLDVGYEPRLSPFAWQS